MKQPKKVTLDKIIDFKDEPAASGPDTADRWTVSRPHPPPEDELGGGDICSPENKFPDRRRHSASLILVERLSWPKPTHRT